MDYGHWGVLQAKGNATAHSKMGALKPTLWQLQSAKVRQWCGEIANRSGYFWKRSSLLAVAIVISS
jgi:hypothetical protein